VGKSRTERLGSPYPYIAVLVEGQTVQIFPGSFFVGKLGESRAQSVGSPPSYSVLLVMDQTVQITPSLCLIRKNSKTLSELNRRIFALFGVSTQSFPVNLLLINQFPTPVFLMKS